MNEGTTSPEGDESALDDLETQQNKIADQLAELSRVEVGPTGFTFDPEPFEPSDVDFSSPGWLLNLLQVQAWLNPNSEVDAQSAEKDPLACARELFSAIGAEAADRCVEGDHAVIRLTVDGAEYLALRLDTAIALQRTFTESLDTLNKKQATVQWTDAWDEESESSVAATEPIRAKTDTWRINDFSGKADRGQLNLNPSYQRGDVWPTSDAQKLIESILRGIPLPSIILLKPASGNKQAKYEVVDGKQRLTSILRFIGQHPRAIARVKQAHAAHPEQNLEQHFRNDYKKFRRRWKSVVGESLTDKLEAEYYFPFPLPHQSPALQGCLSALGGKYYDEIVDEQIEVGEGQETVRDVFEKSSDYKIPLIEYLDATPKQIHEVFHLYNRQGKHLNAEEIRNALFHDVDLVRLVLVASGDNPAAEHLAPYFPEQERGLLTNIARCLTDCRFGTARYRRTKLLSWLFALLFEPAETQGKLSIRSTAKQIDRLFTAIRSEGDNGAGRHHLADQSALIDLVRTTERCLDEHLSSDCWHGKFKDDENGQKWQELQLVASLVSVFLIVASEGSALPLLEGKRDELLAFTKSHPRPTKTQNKTQWAFIGEVALGILEIANIDQARLAMTLTDRYGANCLPTLRAARALY